MAEDIMVTHSAIKTDTIPSDDFLSGYLETLSVVERLHRLTLDVLKDEFERLDLREINSVQALLIYNIGDDELAAGELRGRGYYQGSNVSYNLKKLVELGYVESQRSDMDRRSVRVRLSAKGQAMRKRTHAILTHHAGVIETQGILDLQSMEQANQTLKRIERFLSRQMRYVT
jgi:DNA-binding MarR family transcriptional regulator